MIKACLEAKVMITFKPLLAEDLLKLVRLYLQPDTQPGKKYGFQIWLLDLGTHCAMTEGIELHEEFELPNI